MTWRLGRSRPNTRARSCHGQLRAEEGKIRATVETAGGSEQSERAILSLAGVMRVGGGPPSLQGLVLGELKIRAVGSELREEEASGPVIPVSPPEPE